MPHSLFTHELKSETSIQKVIDDAMVDVRDVKMLYNRIGDLPEAIAYPSQPSHPFACPAAVGMVYRLFATIEKVKDILDGQNDEGSTVDDADLPIENFNRPWRKGDTLVAGLIREAAGICEASDRGDVGVGLLTLLALLGEAPKWHSSNAESQPDEECKEKAPVEMKKIWGHCEDCVRHEVACPAPLGVRGSEGRRETEK